MQRSHSSTGMSSTLPVGPAMPALLIRQSSPPRCLLDVGEQLVDVPASFDTSASVALTPGKAVYRFVDRSLDHVADVHARTGLVEHVGHRTTDATGAGGDQDALALDRYFHFG